MDRETPSKETVIAGRKLSDQGADAQQSPRLILASGSPRRLELLRNLQLEVDVIPSLIEEEISADLAPAELTVGLALAKALAVAGSTLEESSPPTLVLAADTIVVLEGVVIGKPGSKEEAIQILGRLSGRRHEVYTGVALIEHPSNRRLTAYERSSVYFRSITSREIEAYVHTREPMDKAGAYALQGIGSIFVERIEGCFSNIIGLPLPLVVRLLRQFGLSVLGTP